MKNAAILLVFFCLVLEGLGQQQPIYRSAKDSVQLAEIRKKFDELRTGESTNVKTLDSLIKVQSELFSKAVVGWRFNYSPDKTFISYSDLESNTVKPEDVTKLSIAGYNGKKLPPKVMTCKNLQELELVNTRIEKLPKGLDNLTKLCAIEILNNKPARKLKLSQNTHVTYLKIRGEKPDKIPSNYKKFKALDSLDLARNMLTGFPNINKNKKLRQLTLSGNNITLNNLRLKENHSLINLYLRQNKIEILPDEIAKFRALKKLALNHNEIKQVSPEISRLRDLEELSFYSNKLTSIPKGIYELPNLRVIDLYHNQIEKVDPEIANLKNLVILYLSNNRIHVLPDNLGELSNLHSLYIHHNRISYLPNTLHKLKNLEVLRFNANYITTFPDDVLTLKNLKNLDFSENRFQSLPSALADLSKLELVSMTENPWENKEDIVLLANRLRNYGTIVHTNLEKD